MARSRYSETDIIDGHRYASFSLPTFSMGLRDLDLLEGVKIQEYSFRRGDRLDHLAARFWGQDEYWWVIALVNNISYPLGLRPPLRLKIPVNVQDVLSKIFSG